MESPDAGDDLFLICMRSLWSCCSGKSCSLKGAAQYLLAELHVCRCPPLQHHAELVHTVHNVSQRLSNLCVSSTFVSCLQLKFLHYLSLDLHFKNSMNFLQPFSSRQPYTHRSPRLLEWVTPSDTHLPVNHLNKGWVWDKREAWM